MSATHGPCPGFPHCEHCRSEVRAGVGLHVAPGAHAVPLTSAPLVPCVRCGGTGIASCDPVIRANMHTVPRLRPQICSCVREDLAALRAFVARFRPVLCPGCGAQIPETDLRGLTNAALVAIQLGAQLPPICVECAKRGDVQT